MAGRSARPAFACALALAIFAVVCPAALGYRFNAPTATQTGPEEVVFDWGHHQTGQPTGARPRCAEDDIPDTSAHAYRDASGNVVLISSHFINRRFVGSSFDSLTHPCGIVMPSSGDTDPAAFDDHEWITAPYTVDGSNVYALVHEEYQGWRTGYGNNCVGDWLVQQKCWRNSITLATSADGGASFASPGALVASSPYRFSSGSGPYGYFRPTNIVRAADGNYYTTVRTIPTQSTPAQPDGVCLMRTNDLANPRSWRAWDGNGFNVSFIDPYTQSGTPGNHVCAVVDPDLYRMSSSLVYSEYLKRYLLVDLLPGEGSYNPDPADRVPGVYYSTSPDLIHWSPPSLLMEAEFTNSFECGDEDPVRVPSLIDHSSSSRNFETMGARAHLYFTRSNMIYNQDGSCYLGLDRDMVRIPVEFHKPDPPTLSAAFPASPANNNNPRVRGSAPAGTRVTVYTDASCSGAPVGSAVAGTFSTSGIPTSVPDGSTTTFYATATENYDIVSDCSSTFATYVEDSTPPDAPVVMTVFPASPANNNSPRVRGTAAEGSTVKLYGNAACSGQPLGTVVAGTFVTAGAPAAVPDDSTTTIHATATDAAGNTSSCSTSSVTYVEDSALPPAPVFAATNPPSPANDNDPLITGTAAAGLIVKLFAGPSCAGAPVATGTAAAFSAPGLPVTVPDDSVTSFSANAADTAGNTSSCSLNPITYTEASTDHGSPPPPSEDPPPPAPSISVPAGPVTLIANPAMPDRLAPRMTIAAKLIKVGRSGNVRLGLSCPKTEPGGCGGTIRLETLSGSKLAGASFRVAGGKTGPLGMRLSTRGRKLLQRSRDLLAAATIHARDEAGNARTEKVKLVLRAPGRKRNR